jgi:hypothetical protein
MRRIRADLEDMTQKENEFGPGRSAGVWLQNIDFALGMVLTAHEPARDLLSVPLTDACDENVNIA